MGGWQGRIDEPPKLDKLLLACRPSQKVILMSLVGTCTVNRGFVGPTISLCISRAICPSGWPGDAPKW